MQLISVEPIVRSCHLGMTWPPPPSRAEAQTRWASVQLLWRLQRDLCFTWKASGRLPSPFTKLRDRPKWRETTIMSKDRTCASATIDNYRDEKQPRAFVRNDIKISTTAYFATEWYSEPTINYCILLATRESIRDDVQLPYITATYCARPWWR